MNQDRLVNLADAVLVVVEDFYATNGWPLPGRRLITPGQPAWDCEQVTVHVETVVGHGGDPMIETVEARLAHPAFAMRAAMIAVSIIRCVPVINDQGYPPHAADEQAAASDILRDAVRVWEAFRLAVRAGDLPGCGAAGFVGWESVGPEGGFAGGTARFRVSLE